MIPARGVVRRLQALVAAGWTQSRIAQEWGGYPVQKVGGLLRAQKVTVRTFRELSVLYERLSAVPAPREGDARYGFTKAVRKAKRCRWVPPLGWDDIDNDARPARRGVAKGESTRQLVDEIAVELVCGGHDIGRPLSTEEVWEGVRILHGRRMSDPAIAQRLHIEPRSAFRIRAERLELPPWDKNESHHANGVAA